MQDSSADQKSSGSNIGKWGVGTFAMIYFFFPIVFIVPLDYPQLPKAMGDGIKVFIAPLVYLADRIPPYGAFLNGQERLYRQYFQKAGTP